MNQTDLIKSVAKSTGQTIETTHKVVVGAVEAIQAAMKNGEEVRFKELGVFAVKSMKPRTGHNPKTRELFQIPARKIVHFRAVPSFKNMVR